MTTMVSNRRSFFGMNCAQYDNELIAPEWSEYRNEWQVHHVWRCWKCDCCFETIVNTSRWEIKRKRTIFFGRCWSHRQFTVTDRRAAKTSILGSA
jgi:hypothetical protein